MEMKYVVVEDKSGSEQLIVFPKVFDHDAFADVLSYIRVGGSNWRREFRKPVSAGFTDGKRCYGRSETLNLNSRHVDTDLLQKGGTT